MSFELSNMYWCVAIDTKVNSNGCKDNYYDEYWYLTEEEAIANHTFGEFSTEDTDVCDNGELHFTWTDTYVHTPVAREVITELDPTGGWCETHLGPGIAG